MGGHWTQNSSRNGGRRQNAPRLSFPKLLEMLPREADDVITSLYLNSKEWEQLLSQDDLVKLNPFSNGRIMEVEDDMLYIMVLLLGDRVCSNNTSLKSSQDQLVSCTGKNLNFLTKIKEKCRRYTAPHLYKTKRNRRMIVPSPGRFLPCLINFLRLMLEKNLVVDVGDQYGDILNEAHGALESLLKLPEWSMEDRLLSSLERIISLKSEFAEAKNGCRGQAAEPGATDDELLENGSCFLGDEPDFRRIPLLPSFDEIRVKVDAPVRENKISGSYLNADDYLDVQFRLLREDFVRPLREGMLDFYENKKAYMTNNREPPKGGIYLYRNVKLVSMTSERGKIIYVLQLHHMEYENIEWESTNRLMTGSLVFLSNDELQSAHAAIVEVAETEDLKKGKLGVSWEEDPPPDFPPHTEFFMIESNGYYEAYKHTLKVLQEIKLADYPMAKFIVEAQSEVEPPAYLAECKRRWKIGNSKLLPCDPESWPSAEQLMLDERQLEAYKACITQQLSIVQGPPGTGKTYLALRVVETLLLNEKRWKSELDSNRSPILVVCYTNHALDQFMEGVVKVYKSLGRTPNVIRVGGRCASPMLAEFSLGNVRAELKKAPAADPDFDRSKREAYGKMRQADGICHKCIAELAVLRDMEEVVLLDGLFVWKELKSELPEWITNALVSHDWIELDRKLVPNDQSPSKKQDSPREDIGEIFERRQSVGSSSRTAPEAVEDLYDMDLLEQKMPTIHSTSHNALFTKLKFLNRQQMSYWNQQSHNLQGKLPVGVAEKQKILEMDYKELTKKENFTRALLESFRKGEVETVDVDQYFVQSRCSWKELSGVEKWSIYLGVVERATEKTKFELKKATEIFRQTQQRLTKVLRTEDSQILKKASVVGMTTTGAAKYHDLVESMKSKIVIVEEAAKVLEPHIVASLTASCENLILIGDHQQLRPNTAVYELAKKYNFEISLFERMLNNNLNCHTLRVQYRMRPAISNLLVGTIYKTLLNAPPVEEYPNVKGLTSNLFFICHTERDEAEKDSTSKVNTYEADYMTELCRYLLRAGYTPDQITILSTYTGQVRLIEGKMKKTDLTKDVKVTSVDNFQGEENDVILLSIVRSNEEGLIGFLKENNRICVAISRARHGLFMIGNMKQLAEKSETWKKIELKLKEDGSNIGESLEIVCQVHGKTSLITCPGDFEDFAPDGGCQEDCGAMLACGHTCKLNCHATDREHQAYKCKEEVQIIAKCSHKVFRRCFETKFLQDPCNVRATKKLPCGHVATMPCWVDPKDFVYLPEKSELCAADQRETNENYYGPKCEIICGDGVFVLPAKAQCVENSDISDDVFSFNELSEQFREEGAEGLESCGKDEAVDRSTSYEWKENCGKICKNGLHPCSSNHRCHELCPPCSMEMMSKLACGHEFGVPCGSDEDFSGLCSSGCGKTLACGHTCEGSCGSDCEPCLVTIVKKALCGHEEVMTCSSQSSASLTSLCEICRQTGLAPPESPDFSVKNATTECSPCHEVKAESSEFACPEDVASFAYQLYFHTPVDSDFLSIKRELLMLVVEEICPGSDHLLKCSKIGSQTLAVLKIAARYLHHLQEAFTERPIALNDALGDSAFTPWASCLKKVLNSVRLAVCLTWEHVIELEEELKAAFAVNWSRLEMNGV